MRNSCRAVEAFLDQFASAGSDQVCPSSPVKTLYQCTEWASEILNPNAPRYV
ncbi:unnamed protein product [Dovyalis caffra]|uniref:Uncharacterized protein n=1 Tax=Dovyalis caffra TaxID=77055 RepID=A0AAV1S123_9ROSI|nr:unnamed protein product [Dovyalis caffra]